ncbi:MAG: hypothetical protein K1X75_10360 [Leptospirales bacterium]|nr:hypothetical protein [Leptospirales bacterium]
MKQRGGAEESNSLQLEQLHRQRYGQILAFVLRRIGFRHLQIGEEAV